MDFMTCTWSPENEAQVYFKVAEYKPVQVSDFYEIINEIRSRATGLVIKFDLKGAGPKTREEFRSLFKLICDVIDYTKGDGLLRTVYIIGAGFLFRFLYGPLSLLIPREIRDLILFS